MLGRHVLYAEVTRSVDGPSTPAIPRIPGDGGHLLLSCTDGWSRGERIFRPRAEETGIIRVQSRLLDGFRTAKAKVVYTLVAYQPGFPGVTPNSPLYRTAIDADVLLEGTPAVEVMDELAPGPDEPVVRGQATSGFDRTVLDTMLRWGGVDTLVLVGVATDVAVESTARSACDLGYRTIVVADACAADSDEAHAHALEVLHKWFGETPTADEVLTALG